MAYRNETPDMDEQPSHPLCDELLAELERAGVPSDESDALIMAVDKAFDDIYKRIEAANLGMA